MKLYHFSDKNFDTIHPSFFGYNSYTKNDQVYQLPRFFCYDQLKPVEYCFNISNYRYTIEILNEKIYNLDIDLLQLKTKYAYNVDEILAFISQNYDGAVYTTSFKTYVIFKECSVIKKESLIFGKPWS